MLWFMPTPSHKSFPCKVSFLLKPSAHLLVCTTPDESILRGPCLGELRLDGGESGGLKVSCSLLSESVLSADGFMGVISTGHAQQNRNSETNPLGLGLNFTFAICMSLLCSVPSFAKWK